MSLEGVGIGISRRFTSRAVALSTVVLSLAMLSACGGESSSSGGSTSTGGSTAAQQPISMTFGYIPTSEQVLVKIADSRGIFKKHGVAVKYGSPALTGSGQIAQLLNGELDVALGGLTGVISAVAANVPVRVIGATASDFKADGQYAFALVVKGDSPVKTMKDLQGKTVGVNSLGGNWEVTLREAIAKAGGDPKTVKFVAIPFAQQATALNSGAVDAIYGVQPTISMLKAQGARIVGDPQAVALNDQHGSGGVLMMSNRYIKANPEAPKRFVAALGEAASWANSHPDEVKRVIVSETKVPASVINATPNPRYTNAIDRKLVPVWESLLAKYGLLKSSPPTTEVVWEGTPAPAT